MRDATTMTTTVLATLLLAACGPAGEAERGRGDSAPATAGESAISTAQPTDSAATGDTMRGGALRVTMRDATGRDLGTLTVAESGDGVTIAGTLRGIAPGAHAIHVHTTGRCDAPTFESAGAHWNPTDRAHGTANPRGPHLGDLPNLTVGADGAVAVEARTPGGTLAGATALRDGDGAALVIHAKRDDYRTDPAGDAGDRVACGVIDSR